MSQVKIPYISPGDTLSAQDQNDFLDDVSTISGALTSENLREEALNHQNLDFTTGVVIKLYDDMSRVASPAVEVSSETYAVITDGTVPMSLTGLGATLSVGYVVRVYGRLLTRDISIQVPSDDYYFLKIVLGTDAGDIDLLPVAGYSMLTCDTTDNNADAPDEIEKQPLLLSHAHIYTGVDTTLNNVKVYAKVSDSGNTVEFSRYSLSVEIYSRG